MPIIQLSLSSDTLPGTKLNDLGQNIIRPNLAVVHGAGVPQPYGGTPRVIMADLDQQALDARGLTPADVASALNNQNVVLPAGDAKIGATDYTLTINNSPNAIEALNNFPIKQVEGKTVFMHDVAHVHDGYQVQTNSVSVDGKPGGAVPAIGPRFLSAIGCRPAALVPGMYVDTALLLLGTVLSGCAVGPDYEKPDLPAPDSFAAAPKTAQPSVDPARWWKTLGDDDLNSLVERAVAANPDLAIALYRLQEARTQEACCSATPCPKATSPAARPEAQGRTSPAAAFPRC